MALQLWFPLKENTNNLGLSEALINLPGDFVDMGRFGQAYHLRHNNETVYIKGLDGAKQFSVAFWYICKSDETNMTDYVRILSLGCQTETGDSAHDFRFESCYGKNLKGVMISNNTDYAIISSNVTLVSAKDEWHHICVTYNGDTVNSYVDGQLLCTNIGKHGTLTGDVSIGSIYNTGGYINDIRIYDNYLSQKEIEIIHQSEVLHYQLNDTTASANALGETNNGIKNWSFNSQYNHTLTEEYITEDNVKCVKLIQQTDASGWCYASYKLSLDLLNKIKPNTIYTVSFNIKCNVDSNIGVCIQNSNSQGDMTIPHKSQVVGDERWHKFALHIRTIETFDEIVIGNQVLYLYGLHKAGYYIIKDLKFEEGLNVFPSYYPELTEHDCSGHCNNGLKFPNGVLIPVYESPRYDSCYYFNGVNNHIGNIKNPITEQTTEFTISCWIKLDNQSPTQTIYTARKSVGSGIALFIIGEKIRFDDNYQTTFKYITDLTKWAHVCVTRDTLSKKLYINGKLVESSTVVGDMQNIGYYGTIGASEPEDVGIASANYLKGCMSDFRIYATALSEKSVETLFKVSASITNTGTFICSGEVIEK